MGNDGVADNEALGEVVFALPFFFQSFELGEFLHQFLALGFEAGFLFEKALSFRHRVSYLLSSA